MTNWNPDIRSLNNLLSRVWVTDPTTGLVIIAPAGTGIIRASTCGAGGTPSGSGCGHGAAFARVTTTASAGESFTAKNGNAANAIDAGSSAGDSQLLRTSGSVSILLAKRGTGTGPGLASACTGDVKRDGGTAAGSSTADWNGYGDVTNYSMGGCQGDLDDDYSLGIGCEAPVHGYGVTTRGAGPGGGGMPLQNIFRNNSATVTRKSLLAAGHGLMCVEFYRTNPGYGS